MSTKLKIIIALLFLVQGAVFYWSYSDKERAETERLKPYAAYLENPLAVKSMDLSNRNLKEFIIDFSQFKNLEYLDLSHNQFEEIPKELYNLPKLKILNLSHNKFSSILKLYNKNSSIEKLDLSNNQIEGFYYPENGLNYFEGLKVINLNSNRLESTPDFYKIKLDTILMSKNQLRDIGEIEANLPNPKFGSLPYLDISNNDFRAIKENPNEKLSNKYNEFTILAYRCISLNISDNYFTRFPHEIFSDNGLKYLDISNCQIDSSEIIIYNNNNLETLDLSENIGIITESIFENSQKLKKLNLGKVSISSQKLSNETLEELYIEQINTVYNLNFPNLKIINIDVHNKGIERLIKSKEKLPKLEKIIIRKYGFDGDIKRNKLIQSFPNAEIIIESFTDIEEVTEVVQEELLEEN